MNTDTVISITNSKAPKLSIEQKVGEGQNLISTLPDSIILHIFSFLRTKDVLRTSVLLKRWKYVWTSISDIDFDDQLHTVRRGMKVSSNASFLNAVENVLLRRDPSCIRKFRLRCNTDVSTARVHSWIYAAITHKVQEIHLALPLTLLFQLPDSHCTSNTLKILTLERVCFKVPLLIHFSNLKTLRLLIVTFQGDQSTEQILSGCSTLQELCLSHCKWKNTSEVTISVPTLRTLEIIYPGIDNNNFSLRLFRIYAENLITLKCSWLFPVELFLCNLSSLKDAHIDEGNGNLRHRKNDSARHAIKLIGGFHNVKSLTVSNETLKSLSLVENLEASLPTLHSLTHLKVFSFFSDHTHSVLMYFLQKLPNLESLEIPKVFHQDYQWLLNIIPECLKSCLKTIIIAYFGGNIIEVGFLKYLLKNANMLERVTVCTKRFKRNSERENKIYRELQGIRNCVIEFRALETQYLSSYVLCPDSFEGDFCEI